MELQEAINHAREVSAGCSASRDCAYQHDKLADWLEELKALKSILGDNYGMDRLRELVEADRDGRCVVVTRCGECKNHREVDGYHYCKFWRMYCPDDWDFYCKAAMMP